jgi:hypothetical protein
MLPVSVPSTQEQHASNETITKASGQEPQRR